ncbi:MAG TPA: sigma-70 family RNA polymerase sigma factor [Solirubrobacterales bacterium]|nr:sigma-70 family RNA polymerase sigma factor [Solirubrobacterales bacterium]
MAATASKSDPALAAEEVRLARAAAGGDGSAFATLYQRYEGRAYNLAYRLSGSEADAAEATQEAFLKVMRRLPRLEDRELAFGSYLFTATRNACYDLIEQRRRTRPSEAIPETATPVGTGGGGAAPGPGDPEEDPDRKLLLESQQEEIRTATMRMPERQREALALRELEQLSYDEIAAVMEMNRNSVAQLISRARISLRDELRGTALASIVASSPACERALPLIAMRDDGQLEPGGEDDAWLDAHIGGCERCQVAIEAMQEAGVSYRAWTPIAVAPWLLEETMAKAAEQVGADWSEEIEAALAARAAAGKRRFGRRRLVAAATLAAVILVAAVATVLAGDEPTPIPEEPAAATQPETVDAAPAQPTRKKANSGHERPDKKKSPAEPVEPAAPPPPVATPVYEATESSPGGDRKSAKSGGGATQGVQPGRAQASPQPKPQPPAPEPAPEPPTTADPPPADPPVEEEPPEPEDPRRERTPREPPAGIPPPR